MSFLGSYGAWVTEAHNCRPPDLMKVLLVCRQLPHVLQRGQPWYVARAGRHLEGLTVADGGAKWGGLTRAS